MSEVRVDDVFDNFTNLVCTEQVNTERRPLNTRHQSINQSINQSIDQSIKDALHLTDDDDDHNKKYVLWKRASA